MEQHIAVVDTTVPPRCLLPGLDQAGKDFAPGNLPDALERGRVVLQRKQAAGGSVAERAAPDAILYGASTASIGQA